MAHEEPIRCMRFLFSSMSFNKALALASAAAAAANVSLNGGRPGPLEVVGADVAVDDVDDDLVLFVLAVFCCKLNVKMP